jgi:hypothetical protein
MTHGYGYVAVTVFTVVIDLLLCMAVNADDHLRHLLAGEIGVLVVVNIGMADLAVDLVFLMQFVVILFTLRFGRSFRVCIGVAHKTAILVLYIMAPACMT